MFSSQYSGFGESFKHMHSEQRQKTNLFELGIKNINPIEGINNKNKTNQGRNKLYERNVT